MKVDYSKLTLQELNEVIAKAVVARNKLIAARRMQLLTELNELDRLSNSRSSKAFNDRPSANAIYKDDIGNSWRGRGRVPQWLRNHLDNGAKLEDFKVEEKGKRDLEAHKSK